MSGIVFVELRFVCTIACMDIFIILFLNRAIAWLYRASLVCVNSIFDDV